MMALAGSVAMVANKEGAIERTSNICVAISILSRVQNRRMALIESYTMASRKGSCDHMIAMNMLGIGVQVT